MKYRFVRIQRSGATHSDVSQGAPLHYVAYLEKGRAQIVSPRGRLELEAGDAFFIPKGLPYQSYWSDVVFLSLGFGELPGEERYLLQKWVPSPDEREALLAVPTGGGRVDSAALCAFYAALAKVESRLRTELGKDGLLRQRAADLLMEDPHRSVAELARALAVSPSALYAAFARLGEQTPNGLRLEALCARGEALLASTDKSVEEISGLLGFSSSTYFRRVFRRITGRSPRECRKSAMP